MKTRLDTVNKKTNRVSESEYKEFPCDICNSAEAIEVPYARLYTNNQPIHICKRCGFVYVKMRRPYYKIAQTWSKKLFGKIFTAKTPLFVSRHIYVAEFINQEIGLKDKMLCDIGAGEGQFLDIARKNYGASVFGIEPSAANCEILKNLKIDHFHGALEDYINSPDRKKNWADIVTIMWTLEAATSPKDLLMGGREILKEGGYAVVATGSRILVPFAKPLNMYLSRNPADTHPSRFTINTLASLFAVTGFKVRHINRYLGDSDILCMIAQKRRIDKNAKIKRDDYREVRDFFKRWHRDTLNYAKVKNIK